MLVIQRWEALVSALVKKQEVLHQLLVGASYLLWNSQFSDNTWLIFILFIQYLSVFCVPVSFLDTWNKTADKRKIPNRVNSPAGGNK